jgi:hypothetical protein
MILPIDMEKTLKSFLFFIAFLILFSACTQNSEIIKDDGPNLIFAGEWHGNTSQTKLLKIVVDDINAQAWISAIRLGFTDNENYLQRNITATNGIARIEDKKFQFSIPGGWQVNGVFETENTCSGSITMQHGSDEYQEDFTFLLKRDISTIDIHSIAQVKFEVNGKSYHFSQQFNRFFPTSEIVSTDSGYIISSSFNVSGNNFTGTSILTIRYGYPASLDEIREIFSKGRKSFSQNAAQGFEVIFLNPEHYYQSWTTSAESGDQSESRFEIIDFAEIDTGNQNQLFKYIAVFECKVYRKWSDVLEIKDGSMIGYISINH